MPSVTVLVLAAAADPGAGPLERGLADARAALIEHHRATFSGAGADRVIVHREPPDDTPFGARLRRVVGGLTAGGRLGGLVVLGAGAIPLATAADRRTLVAAARGAVPGALANQRYSADVLAIACADETLEGLPDIGTDNALPRWLARTGVDVRDLAGRRHLAVDIDSPLDLVLIEQAPHRPPLVPTEERLAATVRRRLAALRRVAADPGGELLVAGRTSAAELRWLESRTRSRSRVLVEERGLRTAAAAEVLGRANRRVPRSALGMHLDQQGPGALGGIVAALSDGALIDSRVLLAHRLGADERGWPPPEDRYASDLLLPDHVGDPWLRALTEAAVEAPVPVLLGGHTLVGPGLRLALRGDRGARRAP
jgi:hypothetical protein